jgi:hypothetical protein
MSWPSPMFRIPEKEKAAIMNMGFDDDSYTGIIKTD